MTAAEIPQVADALAEAFFDDPHFRWIVREDSVRMGRLQRGYGIFIERAWWPRREIYTHERMIGAAVWMPPGSWHLGLPAQLLMAPAIVRVLRRDTPRLLRALSSVEKHHPREPDHWYLAIVGVRPAWQGRGFGAALLKGVLERCDAEATPAYLEASTARSRVLYERQGFDTLEECRYAKDGPPFWRMWREPQT